MSYDIHIVKTADWLDAAQSPISKEDADALVASDSELAWSSSDWVDMKDAAGTVTRYPMMLWRNVPRFWWYKDQILCSSPGEPELVKLAMMAGVLGALCIGDDGERYRIRRNFWGKARLVIDKSGA